MNDDYQTFYHLAVALAIGLLIGAERGWQEREVKDGKRIAGFRTFGLIGLLGGALLLLTEKVGPVVLGLAFVGLAIVLTIAYIFNPRNDGYDVGITSLIAALLTFILGALAASGDVVVAAASAIIVVLILSYKPMLHRWLRALQEHEIHAGIKLLLISVVLLPILPNKSFGPWQALNPYIIWWMVVLIAIISFVGYFAIKIGGPRHGAFFTGLFGGLASSTAVTLYLSKVSRRNGAMAPLLAIGVLIACGTMYPRMLLVASIFNADLFSLLLVPSILMALLTYLPAVFYWGSQTKQKIVSDSPLKNPLELKSALAFGALLAFIMLMGEVLQTAFGDMGVLVLAAVSGVSDVDAITLSLSRMSHQDLALRVAAMGIVIAASVNSLTKAMMSAGIGGRKMGLRVGIPLLLAAIAGPLATWLWVW